MGQFASQLIPCLILTLLQAVAALPWLWALDSRAFGKLIRKPATWGNIAGVILGVTVLSAFLISNQRGSSLTELIGRLYGAVLQLQLTVDLFIVGFFIMLTVWPKGGAVALAAFREGIRQPMFWLIGLFALMVFAVAIVMPFFTFGDDFKMMKQICFDTTMIAALVFGVLAASISINEEIEGRTAVTLMSKPVTRRQFLIGKYLGIMLAAFALTLLLGWFMNWALYVQPGLNPIDEFIDPLPQQAQAKFMPTFMTVGSGDAAMFMRGFGTWTSDAFANGIGNVLGFGKVMVMLAVASALATRMPMITNLVLCLAVFFLGHLAPVLRRVSEELKARSPDNTALSLVNFLTQVMETITPTLEFFDMGPALIRDSPISLWAFTRYVGSVTAYGLLYTAIALLFGLILFEDRDLA